MNFTNDYPKNWPDIAREIKRKANFKCENCGHKHSPPTGHTLTVHHLDGNKSNCDYTNLVALCQRCHLHVQATYLVGQQFMFKPQWAEVRGL